MTENKGRFLHGIPSKAILWLIINFLFFIFYFYEMANFRLKGIMESLQDIFKTFDNSLDFIQYST